MERDRKFMSVAGRAIWYTRTNDGEVLYMVAKGDGTDEYFTDWREAMKYCYDHPRKNRKH